MSVDGTFAPFLVLAPATTANLGPGFDCLALALDLHNTIEVFPAAGFARPLVVVEGEGTAILSGADANLVVRAMRHLEARLDSPLPPFRLRQRNLIPLGRGLGSSAAAIAGGLVAAATLLELSIAPEALLPFALEIESHPDNVAAALYGGLTIGVFDAGGAVVRRLEPPPGLRAVVLVPEGFSSTLESRAVLPREVSRADAVFNTSRCALLAADLALGRLDSLAIAMQDRLHQPQRGASQFPYLEEAIAAAVGAGAYGAALSGSGSSVLALVAPAHEVVVAAALETVARRHQLPARTLLLSPATEGARMTSG